MVVGNIIKGRAKRTSLGNVVYIAGCGTLDAIIAHKTSLSAGVRYYPISRETIELWKPEQVFGIVTAINKSVIGDNFTVVQVLLETRLIWFLQEDLVVVQ
jgi:hypothetical protein